MMILQEREIRMGLDVKRVSEFSVLFFENLAKPVMRWRNCL